MRWHHYDSDASYIFSRDDMEFHAHLTREQWPLVRVLQVIDYETVAKRTQVDASRPHERACHSTMNQTCRMHIAEVLLHVNHDA